MRDYYDILGVKKEATPNEIKTAYRRLSSKFHPDKNGGDKFFEEQFKKIQEAYSVLSNESSRKKYDREYTTFFSGSGKSHSHHSTASDSSYNRKPKPPNIKLFRSDESIINDGEEITITWEVENATKVVISCLEGNQSNRGQKKVKVRRIKNKEDVKISIYTENKAGVVESHLCLKFLNTATNQVSEQQKAAKIKVYVGLMLLMSIILLLLVLKMQEDNSNKQTFHKQELYKTHRPHITEEKLKEVSNTWRGHPSRPKDFVPLHNGTVVDKRTGLQWMRCTLGQDWTGTICKGKAHFYSYQQSRNIQQVSYAGLSNWRLPTRLELETIVYCSSGEFEPLAYSYQEESCKGNYQRPTIASALFPNTPSDWYWWQESEEGSDYVYGINFSYGTGVNYGDPDRTWGFYVRLVRNID